MRINAQQRSRRICNMLITFVSSDNKARIGKEGITSLSVQFNFIKIEIFERP